MAIEPDTKDWTWVLERPCGECGHDVAAYHPALVPAVLTDAVERWRAVLRRPGAAERHDPGRWSPLEYGAHTRDVITLMTRRLGLMRAEDGATFPDWDADAAAAGYAEQAPPEVMAGLAAAAQAASEAFASTPRAEWDRRGRRSDGAEFTAETLSQYLVHELLHHLHDVRG